MDIASLLRKNKNDVALVIGNGINRYGDATATNSWHDLLVELARKHLPAPLKAVPRGVALTEFYDLLSLKSAIGATDYALQGEFCALMSQWRQYPHHAWIADWARRSNRPILTTNFEQTLARACNVSLQRSRRPGFTDYYPWETCYSSHPIQNPAREFGIWHINGMQHYQRSIRLGLSHYMGSVERARGWLHKGNERRLFSGKDVNGWRGRASWLHAVFNCSLVIIGLGLDEGEVFLRWLLIERARYFRKFPDRALGAWYAYTGDQMDVGKQYFLEGVGVKPVRQSSYDAIYGGATWA